MRVIVTGGAGFIGSAVVRRLLSEGHQVLNIDSLVHANRKTEEHLAGHPQYRWAQVDIRDEAGISQCFSEFDPDSILHLAAESHVDRSIDQPAVFLETNVLGTRVLLDAALSQARAHDRLDDFLFVMVSTDEVFGTLGKEGRFTVETPYDPRSPYSASKAASDHLARAWWHTYGLRTVVTNSTNNYGPYQHPEKLIPHFLLRALKGDPLPVYGTGDNMRDWIHVDDHARALQRVLDVGQAGSTYLIGTMTETTNLALTKALCNVLDEELPGSQHVPHAQLIEFVDDRPGHDFRYAVDSTGTNAALGFTPRVSLEDGLRSTVRWYLENEAWWRTLLESGYTLQRMGTAASNESS